MPCNCGGKKITTWVYKDSSGKTVKTGSELQMKAEMIRAGGTGTVQPK